MIGKQIVNNFMEYLYPWVYLFLHPKLTWICSALFSISSAFYNWWRQRKHKRETKDESHLHMVIVSVFTFDLSLIHICNENVARFQSWEQDYHLQDPGRLALFDEYLEMSNNPFSSSAFLSILIFLSFFQKSSSTALWRCSSPLFH